MKRQSMQPNRFIIILLVLLATLCDAAAQSISRENAVVRAVRNVSPAVVNISSEYEVRTRPSPFYGFGGDTFFDSFFRDFFDPGFERRSKRTSLGSGVIIDGTRGLILTNEHVISQTGTITVILNDEREFEAQIVGADPDSDLAVLKIESKTALPAIDMGDSDDIMIGETIIAIGNPFGFSHTVTTGVVSAVNRNIRTDEKQFLNFIQTDASINPGNSGGPLLNITGELVGINTAIYAKAQGIGFAIPINKAKRIVSDLIRYGEVVQPWIGIKVQPLDEKMALYMKLDKKGGVLVKQVDKESPADTAGINEGDVLLSAGKKPLLSPEDFEAAMKEFAAGDVVTLIVWRNAKKKPITVKTTVYPTERALHLAYDLFGIKVEGIPFKDRFSGKDGVVISEINRRSYLSHIGVATGDLIRKIDEMTIKNVEDFRRAVIKYRKKSSVVVLVQRGNQGYYISVKLP
jgi:Do/DeqQ family serine protease